MDKEEYFRQLYLLNDSSDEEVDTNDAREVLKQSKPSLSASFSSPAATSGVSSSRPSPRKVPAIHRTTSAPVTSNSATKEVASLVRKSSLLRYDISTQDFATPPSGDNSFVGQTPTTRPVPEKSASTPNIGSVVMNHSKGIADMLRKRKRGKATEVPAKASKKTAAKKDSFKLAPEGRRFFTGQVLFWIPNNLNNGPRKIRINKTREYGAGWSDQWNSDITHVVVEDGCTYNDVKNCLLQDFKCEIPANVHLVNQHWTIDCTEHRSVVDPKQKKYLVPGVPIVGKEPEVEPVSQPMSSQKSDKSLQLKAAKPRRGGFVAGETPSQSLHQFQAEPSNNIIYSSTRVSLIPEYARETELVEIPRESTSPVNIGKRGDALDEWIDVARKLEYLPIDDDEDEEKNQLSSEEDLDDSDNSAGSEEERVYKKNLKKHPRKIVKKGEGLACINGGTRIALEDNPNSHTIEILGQMGKYYERIRDQWRTLAYRKVVGSLKKQTKKISRYEEAIQLQFIGHRLALKIEEIVLTGHLRRLDNALLDPNDKVLQMFLNIYGSGPGQADKWIQAGCKTLDDLRALPNLHKNQKIGIEHYDDFTTRIPRDEVTALGDIVKKAAREIDPQVEAIIGGSYRRGAATSGDIDFIITKRGTNNSLNLLPFLNMLVDRLTRDQFLVCALAVPHSTGSKWHGACVLPGNPIWRRIDFLIVPETEFGAALLYFTGDDIFNRSMRLLASKKGMRLNQRGLYEDVMRGPRRIKLNEGRLLEGADERRIFDALGVPWRPPQERICHEVRGVIRNGTRAGVDGVEGIKWIGRSL